MYRKKIPVVVSALLSALLTIPAAPQSLTSEDITGIVTDSSNAVLPNVTVTLTNNETGAKQTQNTNASGAYRFALLNPGNYAVSAATSGFCSPRNWEETSAQE
jgi:Carboxypeptidase regulatory-like domain